MNDPKADALLNLSLSLPETLREQSFSLQAAENQNRWEVIVLTSGDLTYLNETHPQITVIPLYEGFAILFLPKELLPFLSTLPEVLYIEMPKYLFFELQQGISASCILPAAQPPMSLTGKGVLVGIVDSGIDLTHPDFRHEDGSTRVLSLWDQEASSGPAPLGFPFGTEYDEAAINDALRENRPLSSDRSGHGTAVAGIACGNGRASEGRNRGIAPKASLIVVKMAQGTGSYPRTTELMTGVNYCIEKSLRLSMPLALNLSFGNNYGSHTGTSLLEIYLNRVSLLGRISIIVASGNEGASPIHTSGILTEKTDLSFSVGPRQASLSLQLWKDYADVFAITLIAPSGRTFLLPDTPGTEVFSLDQNQIAFYNSEPSPFQRQQELFFEFLPTGSYLTSGIWTLRLEPISIKNGAFQLWLPGGGTLNTSTRFLASTPDNTLTIPSTTSSVITVGAYDSRRDQPADFSGRGLPDVPPLFIKPDLVAPGVSIQAPASPDTYQDFTGTSFAAPFVTGSAALMMEWGILQGNSPFLYGERLKAWLISGARQLPGFPSPNVRTGWGALCLKDAFPDSRR